jgi:hypothetical protein
LNDREEPQDVHFFIKTKCFFQGNWGIFYFFQEVLVLKVTGEPIVTVLSLPLGRSPDPESPAPQIPIHTKKQPGIVGCLRSIEFGYPFGSW